MPDNTEEIKKKIVDTYRRGVCDKDGVTLPKSKWGRNGKGSAFGPPTSSTFRENYTKIFPEEKLNIWERDKNGNLI